MCALCTLLCSCPKGTIYSIESSGLSFLYENYVIETEFLLYEVIMYYRNTPVNIVNVQSLDTKIEIIAVCHCQCYWCKREKIDFCQMCEEMHPIQEQK